MKPGPNTYIIRFLGDPCLNECFINCLHRICTIDSKKWFHTNGFQIFSFLHHSYRSRNKRRRLSR